MSAPAPFPSTTSAPKNGRCASCGSVNPEPFFEIKDVPAHSVLLMETREQACAYPTGNIRLAFCPECGFIGNSAFDPGLQDYSCRYEETQEYSATFNQFHADLARELIHKYDLHEKHIVEIGCGKGAFLTLLCKLGDNRGIGFDPAFVRERSPAGSDKRIRFIEDFYSEKDAHFQGDFLCCKMTLEHIPRVGAFIAMVRRSIKDGNQCVVFFQVPNFRSILKDCAYWDIYYEHCSYFSAGSLSRLFRRSGFEVLDLRTAYNDQYLMIEARPSDEPLPHHGEESIIELRADVEQFAKSIRKHLADWRLLIDQLHGGGQKLAFWGGGSKCVAFISALGVRDEVPYAVDINPFKQGTFLPGSGHEIISPERLRDYRPDSIIVLNPIYCGEIRRHLESLGLRSALLVVGDHAQ